MGYRQKNTRPRTKRNKTEGGSILIGFLQDRLDFPAFLGYNEAKKFHVGGKHHGTTKNEGGDLQL